MTPDDIETALRVLLWLSEMESSDGRLKDEIAHVRFRLDEWIEMLEEDG